MIDKLMKLISPPKDIVGIDIGNYSIKIACFGKDKSGVRLTAWGHIPLNFKPDVPPDVKKVQIGQEIKTFLNKKGVSAQCAATSISGNAVIVRYVKLPKLTKKELSLTISVEAEPFIPFDIKDVYLTCYILNEIMEEGQKKMETVLVAAKKEAIRDKIDIISHAGLFPLIIDVDSFALEALYSKMNPQPDNSTVLILNIGHKVTNLSIVRQGVTRVVRDIFIAGATFNKSIGKMLKVEQAESDALKKSKGILVTTEEKEAAIEDYDKQALLVSKASIGVMRDLCSEVSRSIDFYLSQGAEQYVSRIILTGGMSNLKNISTFLASEFKVPVEILNPFAFMEDKGKDVPGEILPSMAVAAGLGLREFKDWE
jgi:type IV pilus assembly protein PilM